MFALLSLSPSRSVQTAMARSIVEYKTSAYKLILVTFFLTFPYFQDFTECYLSIVVPIVG